MTIRFMPDLNMDGRSDPAGRLNDRLYAVPIVGDSSTFGLGAPREILSGGWSGWSYMQFGPLWNNYSQSRPDFLGRLGDRLYAAANRSNIGGDIVLGPWQDLGHGWATWDYIQVADVNFDGIGDVVGRFNNHLWVRLGSAPTWVDYSLGPPIDLGRGWDYADAIQFCDFDGQHGHAMMYRQGDVLCIKPRSYSTAPFFGSPVSLGGGWATWTLMVGTDINADGRCDIVGRFGDGLYARFGLGGGINFGPVTPIATGVDGMTNVMFGYGSSPIYPDLFARQGDQLKVKKFENFAGGLPAMPLYSSNWTTLGNGWGTWTLVGSNTPTG